MFDTSKFFALSAFQHTNLSSKLFLLTARTRLLGEVGLYIRGFIIRQFLNEADTSSNMIGVWPHHHIAIRNFRIINFQRKPILSLYNCNFNMQPSKVIYSQFSRNLTILHQWYIRFYITALDWQDQDLLQELFFWKKQSVRKVSSWLSEICLWSLDLIFYRTKK